MLLLLIKQTWHINHSGSSDRTETQGVIEIFLCYIDKNGLQHLLVTEIQIVMLQNASL